MVFVETCRTTVCKGEQMMQLQRRYGQLRPTSSSDESTAGAYRQDAHCSGPHSSWLPHIRSRTH